MNRPHFLLTLSLLLVSATSWAQLPPPPLPQPQQPAELPPRTEARQDVIVNWTLGDQVWDFRDIRTAYDPVRGFLEPRPNQGMLAVWKLRMVKDFEEGASRFHEEMRGSPFKVVLLDADRTVINPDVAAVQITPVTGRMNDTIELLIGLPNESLAKNVKLIRVQRRTDVGF